MKATSNIGILLLFITGNILTPGWISPTQKFKDYHFPNVNAPASGKYLYVAVPGIRDYLGYGGHGLLVFDINNNHRFVKRIKTQGLHPDKTPSNVKGVAVSLAFNSIYISTIESL